MQQQKQCITKQNEVYKRCILKPHYKVLKVVDGDGFIAEDYITFEQKEIRLLGIDAPEVKKCTKLLQDERELQIPGQLLIELRKTSHKHLLKLLPSKQNISLYIEPDNEYDKYGRTLAYVLLPTGVCVNEILLREGMAKPYLKAY